MPTFLAVLVTAGDFLSGWMAKAPVEGKVTASKKNKTQPHNPPKLFSSENLHKVHPLYLGHRAAALTFALVNEQTAGPSEVNSVVDLEALQVLTHLPALGKFRINAFKVNLWTRVKQAQLVWEKSIHSFISKGRHLPLKAVPSPPGPRSPCHHRWTRACTDAQPACRRFSQTDRCAALGGGKKTNWIILGFGPMVRLK